MEKSPLGRLSPEMRNAIYELALTADEPLTVCSKPTWPNPTRSVPTCTQPALTKVCRQVREETLMMFYHSNTFLLEVCGPGADPTTPPCGLPRQLKEIARWLSHMEPKHRASIQNLHLMVKMCFVASRATPEWRALMAVLERYHYHGLRREQKMKVTVRLCQNILDSMSRWATPQAVAAYAQDKEKFAVKFFEAEGLEIQAAWMHI